MNVVVGAIIEKDGKYLLVQEAKKRCYEQWNFPAGRLEVNESLEQAAIREVKEETVRKAFLKGNCEVLVILEDSDREILLDDFSSDEDIKKYLGASFINPKR